MQNLFNASHKALMCQEPELKCEKVAAIVANFANFNRDKTEVQEILVPGRPELPELVAPKNLPKRGLGSIKGRAALLHAICHIEFNAINLALDAVYRFQDLPEQYYRDWLRVAKEEAYHFSLVHDYLVDLGFNYGSFVAHDGLWQMAVKTAHDPLIRMALVPRVMEARGLDVTPGILAKFKAQGDERACEILHIIMRDEVGHVAIGSNWFSYLCGLRDLDPVVTFQQLVAKYCSAQVKPPFALEARSKAGFKVEEIAWLDGMI